jgi:uncharacterized protein (DUF2235 family)
MPRNLVMCLDGTAGQVRGPGDSNSVRIYDLLAHGDESQQLAYYDPGVGTFSSPGAWTPFARWFSRTGGLIWGGGLRENIGDAYSWLMRTWQPGDRVFVFGFSRGAFTARALTGMLREIGLLRPGSENLLQYAVAAYATPGGRRPRHWDEDHRFAALFAQESDAKHHTTVPITYLGLWDTVKAMGIARSAPAWPYTRSLPNARRIRHAVSIDERRRPFREYLVETDSPETLEEVWFPGVHSDVGGTFPDDPGLSTITLQWVIEGAVQEGMLVDEKRVQKAFATLDPNAAAHRNGWGWSLLVPRHRPIPEGAVLHATVRTRMQDSGYTVQLPKTYHWDDEPAGAKDAAAPAAPAPASVPPAPSTGAVPSDPA